MQVTEMDALCEKIIGIKAEIAEHEETIDGLKSQISDIITRVEEYFIETNRTDPYKSPNGTLYMREDTDIRQPKGPQLKALFEHFVQNFGEEIAWAKMSIHNATLKSEYKQHQAAVELRGGDPILEPLPGIEPPTLRKSLQFRKSGK